MIFRLTLDNLDFTPIEWQQAEFVASWQDDVFTVTGSQSVTFEGEAYSYLRSQFDANYCGTIDCIIYISDSITHKGLIFLSEIEWDLIKCQANCSISDNGFLAIIENKKEQPYFLAAGRDSSNNPISPATSVDIDFHNVTTGASEGERRCYTIHEAFRYLIEAMTDGSIGFVSDYFDTGGQQEGLVVVSGSEIINPSPYLASQSPNISYANLWDSLRVLHNLRAALETVNGQLVVRIEPYSYWRQSEPGIFIDKVTALSERADADKLYSTIKAGSNQYTQATDETPNTSYPDISLITWDIGTYGVIGSCVTSNTLELSVNDLVIDSNSIENALNGNEDNITDNFLVETDGSAAIKYDTIGNGLFYYNQELNNQAVIGRWADRVHNSAVFDNGDLLGDFEASLSADTALWDFTSSIAIQPDYDNVISDPGGDYNPALLTGTYTLPATGLYVIRADYEVEITWSGLSPASAVIDTALVLFGPFTYELRKKTFFNPNNSAEQVSTVVYRWSYLFGIEGNATQPLYLVNSAESAVVGVYKSSTQWGSSTVLTPGNRIPIIQTATVDLCLNDYLDFLDNIKLPATLKNQLAYINSITYRPFGLSEIEVEYIRNS